MLQFFGPALNLSHLPFVKPWLNVVTVQIIVSVTTEIYLSVPQQVSSLLEAPAY